MRQLHSYGDERQLAWCAFCSREPDTKDHCPSKVLLDAPYPENLPVVRACKECNTEFSLDEEYLACLISCVLAGSTNPNDIRREKIKRILADKPSLRSRIERSRHTTGTDVVFDPEHDRVNSVVTKLAQGHALYELHEPHNFPPSEIIIKPLLLMDTSERLALENPEIDSIWPEVGSRAMQRMVSVNEEAGFGWIEVQPQRYRYRASIAAGLEVGILIQEYLGCIVRWES